ncbi:GNAT family N-acetyltransferase [Sphingobacterium sp. N143]|uniref:GNAT family N-acetyltransferase n=1 Tax=Sphingobacterium sp. N143 TaxID=2746727 RepID=UPI002576A9C1|nr:GNAT family N-acetyltransferase [Sphingobacterium sp. N143]MDM1296462.1 GNAT family N-acetyltransferase [Sphingobacterium sp. N143]
MKKMFIHSNLIVTAWHQNRLIGIARSMTDYGYWCYLADLAVASDYQNQGIGRKLLEHTKAEAGKDCMLLLLSAPSALSYYSKLGLRHLQNAFGLDRET